MLTPRGPDQSNDHETLSNLTMRGFIFKRTLNLPDGRFKGFSPSYLTIAYYIYVYVYNICFGPRLYRLFSPIKIYNDYWPVVFAVRAGDKSARRRRNSFFHSSFCSLARYLVAARDAGVAGIRCIECYELTMS